MTEYLHFLHHCWYDPMSAEDRLKMMVFFDFPLILIGGVLLGLWLKFWSWYNDE